MKEEKVVSIEERIPKLQEQRRKKANRTLLSYLLLFFFLIALIIYLQSPLSNIKKIEVKGNHVISDEEIIAYSDLSIGTNLWRINKKEISKQVQKHPIIDKVTVERKFPQTLQLNISEKKIIGYMKKKDEYLPVLDDGVVVNEINIRLPRSAPLLENFKDEQYLQRLSEELKEVPNYILNLISEIHWEPSEKNKYKIILYMTDGYIVHATIRDFASKMKSYPSVIAQLEEGQKAIIHMDVGIYVETLED